MNRRTALALVATASLVAPGCAYVATFAIAGGIAAGSWYLVAREGRDQWRRDLASAPTIENPIKSGVAAATPVHGAGGGQFQINAYSKSQMCFGLTEKASADDIQSLRYQLEGYRTEDPDEKNVPQVSDAAVRVLDEQTRMVQKEITKQDVTRAADGEVIATTDHEETVTVPEYTTQAEVCFPDPAVPDKQSKYLVLRVKSPEQPNFDFDHAIWHLK